MAYEFDPLGDDVGTYNPYLYGGDPCGWVLCLHL